MERIIDISMSDVIAIVAALVAVLSALYARRSANEAKKANDIGRLNALLSFRTHYLELMRHQAKLADHLRNSDGGMQAVRDKYSDLDDKLREVSAELDKYHRKVIDNDN